MRTNTMTNTIKKKIMTTKRGAMLGIMCLFLTAARMSTTKDTAVDAFSLHHHHHSVSTSRRPIQPLAVTKLREQQPGAAVTKDPHRRFLGLQASSIDNDQQDDSSDSDKKQQQQQMMNPTPVFVSVMSDWMVPSEKKKSSAISAAVTGAALIAMMLLFASPDMADAAMSGGRMGGSFSAPRSSSSSSTMSRPSSYSGGGSGGYSYSGGYDGGYGYSHGDASPDSTIAPTNSPYEGLVYAIFFVIYRTIRGFASLLSSMTKSVTEFWSAVTTKMAIAMSSALGPGMTVAQISVALEVPNRDDSDSILNALQRLSQTAKTDSRAGIQSLTSQVALELLHRKSSIVSAATQSKHFNVSSPRDPASMAQREFNARAIQERGKFEQETISKFMGVDYGSSSSSSLTRSDSGSGDNDSKATMAVITLVIAISGDSTQLPTIHSMRDVEDALCKIASDVKVDECLQSAEILWTPTDRGETLTQREVEVDYPELRTV
jgi:uncharacterized membrane protein